jgi:hypothetical protein
LEQKDGVLVRRGYPIAYRFLPCGKLKLQGTRMKGISNATMKFEFPLTVKLEMYPLHG